MTSSDVRFCGLHGDDTTSGRCASCDRLQPDEVLLSAVNRYEATIRTASAALDAVNAEWRRRHADGPCGDACREPMAGVSYGASR